MGRSTRSFVSVLMTVGVATMGLTGAASAASPSILVAPATGLVKGQSVTVSGSGYGANEQLVIVECLTNASGQSGCDLSALKFTTTTPAGSFSTSFNVITGAVGSGTCGTSASDLNCSIAVGNVAQTEQATAAITFASVASTTTTTTLTTTTTTKSVRRVVVRPASGLRNGSRVTVSGSGFTPGDHVFIVECLASVKGASQCNLPGLKTATIRPSGVLVATTFKVKAGTIGTGSCGTKATNAKSCVITVGNAAKGDAALAHIIFAVAKR